MERTVRNSSLPRLSRRRFPGRALGLEVACWIPRWGTMEEEFGMTTIKWEDSCYFTHPLFLVLWIKYILLHIHHVWTVLLLPITFWTCHLCFLSFLLCGIPKNPPLKDGGPAIFCVVPCQLRAIGSWWCRNGGRCRIEVCSPSFLFQSSSLHPRRLTAGTWEYGPPEEENHLNQTIILRFYVNLRGCKWGILIGSSQDL